MPFIPHTEKDKQEMLACIGAPDVQALFDEIPLNYCIRDSQTFLMGSMK